MESEFLFTSEKTNIDEPTQQQVRLIDVQTPVTPYRLSCATIKSFVLNGLSHNDLNDIGEYSHATLDSYLEDYVAHAANQNIHLSSLANILVTPLNSWTDISGQEPLQICNLKNGLIWLHGVIKDGTTTSGTIICTVGAGWLPYYDKCLRSCVWNNAGTYGIGILQVQTDGNVKIFGVGGNTWLQIDALWSTQAAL